MNELIEEIEAELLALELRFRSAGQLEQSEPELSERPSLRPPCAPTKPEPVIYYGDLTEIERG